MKSKFIFRPVMAAVITLLLFASASCTVETRLEIHNDASGSAEVTVTLHPVAVMYMTDITASLAGAEAQGPFDIEAIRSSFLEREGVELERIETVNSNTLRLTVVFTDVRKLLAPSSGEGKPPAVPGLPVAENPVTFRSDSGGRELGIRLSRANFHRISGLFVLPDSPVTVLLPYAREDFMPKEEYLEVLSYALEDYLGGVSVDEFMRGAEIYAEVRADGPVTAAAGGKIAAGAAEFSIPLLDILTLEKEMSYSVIWK